MVKYDYGAIADCIESVYSDIYNGKLHVNGRKYLEMYDTYIKYPSFIGFVRNLVQHRPIARKYGGADYYTSDREVVALMYYVDKSGMKFKPKAKKKSAWDPPYY